MCVSYLFFNSFTWAASLREYKKILNSHSVYFYAIGRTFTQKS